MFITFQVCSRHWAIAHCLKNSDVETIHKLDNVNIHKITKIFKYLIAILLHKH